MGSYQVRRRLSGFGAPGAVGLVVTLVLSLASAALAQVFPEPQKYVVDAASVLSQDTEDQLNTLLGELETRTTIEVAVVTVHTTAPLESKPYATALFNRWGIGQREKNNGVLILLAVQDRAIEIEVGYGLEPILPDGRVGRILDESFVPSLRQSNWDSGLLTGTRAITTVLSQESGQGATSVSPTTPVQPPRQTVPVQPPRQVVPSQPVRQTVPTSRSSTPAAILLVLGLLGIGGAVVWGLLRWEDRKPQRCPKCQTMAPTDYSVVTQPTYDRSGLARIKNVCPNAGCGLVIRDEERALRQLRQPVSSGRWSHGGGGWGSGSRSSSFGGIGHHHRSSGFSHRSSFGGSRRSFGGGRSGGGGAGRRF